MLTKINAPSLLLAILTASVPAQIEKAPAAPFVIEAGVVEILDLVNQSADHLDWNILVNEAEIQNQTQGGTTLVLQNPIKTDAAGCADVLTSMLLSKGLVLRTMNAKQNLYEVISTNGPRARTAFASPPLKTAEQVLSRSRLCMPVSTVVQLKHINATRANNALRAFFAQSSGSNPQTLVVGNAGGDSTLLLTGLQSQVASAILIVRESDVPQPAMATPDLARRVNSLESRLAKIEKALAQLSGKK